MHVSGEDGVWARGTDAPSKPVMVFLTPGEHAVWKAARAGDTLEFRDLLRSFPARTNTGRQHGSRMQRKERRDAPQERKDAADGHELVLDDLAPLDGLLRG